MVDHVAQRVISASVVAQFRALSAHARQIRTAVCVLFTFVRRVTTGFGIRISYFFVRTRTLKRTGSVQTFGTRMTRILNAFVDILAARRRALVTVSASTVKNIFLSVHKKKKKTQPNWRF